MAETQTHEWSDISEEELLADYKDPDGDSPVESYEEKLELLADFDLEPVTEQLEEDGVEDAAYLEAQFRRFTQLRIQRPSAHIAPAPKLDEYWHKLILDTRRYHDFCDQIVGQYWHHIPA